MNHASTRGRRSRDPRPTRHSSVTALDSEGTLHAAITDSSALAPMVRELTIEDEAGRGMQIVQQLTTRSGVEQDRSGDKRVWVERR